MATRGSAAWLIDEVEAYGGANMASGRSLESAQAGYDRFLRGVHPRNETVHTWSFLAPATSEIRLTASAEGTATGVYTASASAPQVGTMAVTTTTAILDTTDHVNKYMIVDNVGTYRMTAVASTTTATLQVIRAQDIAGFTAELVWVAGIYDLPTNFGGLLEPLTYLNSSDYNTPIIQVEDPNTIMGMWRDNDDVGVPDHYAIGSRDQADTAASAYQLYVAPRPEYARTVRARYRIVPAALTDSATVYLLGGPEHYGTIRQCALAAAEQLESHAAGIMTAQANLAMIGSIQLDAGVYETSGPISLADADTGLSIG